MQPHNLISLTAILTSTINIAYAHDSSSYSREIQHPQEESKKLIAQEHKGVSNTLGLPSKACPAQKTNTSNFSNVKDYQLLVFASFSMPELILSRLSSDLQKIGGRLLLRGLINNSFKATAQKIQALGIEADIDPPLFEQFQITQVPTFILATVQNGNILNARHDRIAGNVTLKHALEQFADHGDNILISAHLLKDLRAP